MLHEIEQRPFWAARHRHVEAGRRSDRGAEGGRPFVNQPQMIRERQSLLHSGFLPVCSENRTAIFAADAAAALARQGSTCRDLHRHDEKGSLMVLDAEMYELVYAPDTSTVEALRVL
ncbi:hypothetical protein OG559_22125 [Micromonospora sp. NBC_01405]|uniref:hypothetical protein n=1 Tax=Micromonospora sp. NBC_01405 TaxID=2903589 RepID=UPI0032551382